MEHQYSSGREKNKSVKGGPSGWGGGEVRLLGPEGQICFCFFLNEPSLTLLLDSRNLARILHEEADNPVIRTDGTGLHGKSQQWTGSSVERLSFGSVSFCRFLCRVASALVCPCDLGECSLVCWLFFQNLPGIGGYGLQCLGLEEFLATFLFQKLVISSTQSVLPIFKL